MAASLHAPVLPAPMRLHQSLHKGRCGEPLPPSSRKRDATSLGEGGLVTASPSSHAAAPEPQRGRCGDSGEDRIRSMRNSSDPLQPEPPRMQPLSNTSGARGGPGGMHSLAFPLRLSHSGLCKPAASPGFAVARRAARDLFPACVSLRLPQASLGDCEQSLSLVARKRPAPYCTPASLRTTWLAMSSPIALGTKAVLPGTSFRRPEPSSMACTGRTGSSVE